jgi:phosphonate transport system substrate-binding protein
MAEAGWWRAGLAGAMVSCLSAAGPASADWRQEIGTFRIGMLADPGTERTVDGLAEIRNAYETALAMPVELFVARDYAALIDALENARIEYAILSATAFAAGWRRCGCVEPLAAPGGAGSAIRSVLIVRKSSTGAGNPRYLEAGPDSVAAHLLPRLALATKAEGLPFGAGNLVPAASESESVGRFAAGEADGLFGWIPASAAEPGQPLDGTFERLAIAGVDPAGLEILWSSEPLRQGPHVVRAGLDAQARRLLTRFLIGLADADPDLSARLSGGMEGGFLAVGPQDYGLALALVDLIAREGAP